MLRIPQPARNKECSRAAGGERLIRDLKNRKLWYFEHIIRGDSYNLLELVTNIAEVVEKDGFRGLRKLTGTRKCRITTQDCRGQKYTPQADWDEYERNHLLAYYANGNAII